MKGAIIGDIVGSRFEFNNLEVWEWDFDLMHPLCHFTPKGCGKYASDCTSSPKRRVGSSVPQMAIPR